jgi:hypothetical protein
MAAATNTPFSPDDSVAMLINTLVESLKPLYITLIITCIWSAMLVPLFVILLFFSNRETRRKPIFLGNLFAISLGIAFAGVVLTLMVSVLLDPLAPPSAPLSLAFAALLAFNPLLVESVLLIRLWAVYPFRSTPRTIFFAVFIPVTLLKIARVTNAIVYLVDVSKRFRDGENALLLLQSTWTTIPNYKIEWFLQVADNTSASLLFLFKLNKGRGLSTRVTGGRWSSAIEALFWIAVSNFVIPVMLSIVQLIVIWTSDDIFNVSPICIVNQYIEIIGVLLATVWAAGTKWQDEQKPSRSTVQVLTTVDVNFGITDISSPSLADGFERKK